MFSFILKQEVVPSNVLYYEGENGKEDTKIHEAILQKGLSDSLKHLTIARLRARTGLSLEDAISLIKE